MQDHETCFHHQPKRLAMLSAQQLAREAAAGRAVPSRRCAGRTVHGSTCNSYAITGTRRCFHHSRDQARLRRDRDRARVQQPTPHRCVGRTLLGKPCLRFVDGRDQRCRLHEAALVAAREERLRRREARARTRQEAHAARLAARNAAARAKPARRKAEPTLAGVALRHHEEVLCRVLQSLEHLARRLEDSTLTSARLDRLVRTLGEQLELASFERQKTAKLSYLEQRLRRLFDQLHALERGASEPVEPAAQPSCITVNAVISPE
jgi:hypothetical protein